MPATRPSPKYQSGAAVPPVGGAFFERIYPGRGASLPLRRCRRPTLARSASASVVTGLARRGTGQAAHRARSGYAPKPPRNRWRPSPAGVQPRVRRYGPRSVSGSATPAPLATASGTPRSPSSSATACTNPFTASSVARRLFRRVTAAWASRARAGRTVSTATAARCAAKGFRAVCVDVLLCDIASRVSAAPTREATTGTQERMRPRFACKLPGRTPRGRLGVAPHPRAADTGRAMSQENVEACSAVPWTPSIETASPGWLGVFRDVELRG